MAKARIKFIPLEVETVLADTDFQAMDAEQRGVYWSLILYMYANDGKCLRDMQHIGRITGCRNIENVWHKIKKKFQIKEDQLTHKRVSRELRRAKRLLQAKRKSGLKGAKQRWQSHSKPNGKAMANENVNENINTNVNRNVIEEREERISNSNTNTRLRFPVFTNTLRGPTGPACRRGETGRDIPGGEEKSDSFPIESGFGTAGNNVTPDKQNSEERVSFCALGLRFHDALVALIRPRNSSDRTSFRKISNWLVAQCKMGKFNEQIFERAYDYAIEARKGRNPAAVFTSLMKKELNYK